MGQKTHLHSGMCVVGTETSWDEAPVALLVLMQCVHCLNLTTPWSCSDKATAVQPGLCGTSITALCPHII